MTIKLQDAQSIILFRFHDNPEQARERIKILKHFNPSLPIHVLFGGKKAYIEDCKKHTEDLVESFWHFDQSATPHWKWLHGDLLHKAWYRDFGHSLDFDFLFSYEYDLLILAPLLELYPNVSEDTLALAACEPFTNKIEQSWSWTTEQLSRANFLKFCEYMNKTYGIKRQGKVCLGPGSLFPKTFLEAFSKTEDVMLVHEELAYPAYAEALGFKMVDHGMHPGFGKSKHETRFFRCDWRYEVPAVEITQELQKQNGCRAFHPVKNTTTLLELGFEL